MCPNLSDPNRKVYCSTHVPTNPLVTAETYMCNYHKTTRILSCDDSDDIRLAPGAQSQKTQRIATVYHSRNFSSKARALKSTLPPSGQPNKCGRGRAKQAHLVGLRSWFPATLRGPSTLQSWSTESHSWPVTQIPHTLSPAHSEVPQVLSPTAK